MEGGGKDGDDCVMDAALPVPTTTWGETEEGTHILFVPAAPKAKTKVWWILNRYDHGHLGWIAWYSHWRKYSFTPNGGSVYEEKCLREIADFCEKKTKEHKAAH